MIEQGLASALMDAAVDAIIVDHKRTAAAEAIARGFRCGRARGSAAVRRRRRG